MIVKSRTLSYDSGPYTALVYKPKGSATHCSSTPLSFNYDRILGLHDKQMLLATALRSAPYASGTEYFESTERERPYYNKCKHTKLQGFNYSYFMLANVEDTYVGVCSTAYVGQYLYGLRSQSVQPSTSELSYLGDNGFDAALLDGLPNAQRNAWQAMQPRFEGQVDLLNALFELKDFRNATKQLVKLGTPVNILRALRSGVRRPKNALTALDLSKPAAGLFLTNALAIQPLLSDYGKIMSQITTIVDYKQQEFKIAGYESQKSHYSVDLLDSNLQESSRTPGTFFDEVYGHRDELKFTATLEYTYEYKLRNLISAFTKYWGLNLDYEAMWNGIPFSFLLDYFATLGDSIHNMERDMNVNLAFTQYCESLLRTKTSGCFLSQPTSPVTIEFFNGYRKVFVDGQSTSDSGVDLSTTSVPVACTRSSNYRRVITAPNKGAALPFFKKPTTHQGLVMASLARTIF